MNDPEIKAIQQTTSVLGQLTEEQRRNVLTYLGSRFTSSIPLMSRPNGDLARGGRPLGTPSSGESLGDFFDAVDPKTEADRVLVVAYWHQEVLGGADFDSFSVNKDLKQLGHSVSNITRAIDTLIRQTPRLAIQTGKTGSSKQARKTYRVTREGVKRVQSMITEGNEDSHEP